MGWPSIAPEKLLRALLLQIPYPVRSGRMLMEQLAPECKTDPDARLYRKSRWGAYHLCHMGHVLMENRNGV